jgi:hypothetical protein
MGVVCGSDNHMFGTIHNPDRMTRSATSTIVGQGAQFGSFDPSNFFFAGSANHSLLSPFYPRAMGKGLAG